MLRTKVVVVKINSILGVVNTLLLVSIVILAILVLPGLIG